MHAGVPHDQSLTNHLKSFLQILHDHPSPKVQNPPTCKKRASVALILRLRPCASHWPNGGPEVIEVSNSFEDRLQSFFDQSWVQHADPEILFIKRAARTGDRWTGHLALPGGKREPGDGDDLAAGIRETWEEIGLDLTDASCLAVGNLPERIVTTSWGKVALMVLCSHVHIILNHKVPPLRLQPSEVASAHWVPLRVLLSPSLKTFEYADVSDRLAKPANYLTKSVIRLMLGRMEFAAIHLIPSESLYCSSAPGFISEVPAERINTLAERVKRWWSSNGRSYASTERPLLLWGLTLGIMTDFLKMLPPHDTIKLWTWPSFSHYDTRLIVWIVAYAFRKRKHREAARDLDHALVIRHGRREILGKESDLGEGQNHGESRFYGKVSKYGTVDMMLDGYYDLLRRAVFVSLLVRIGIVSAALVFLGRIYRRHREARSLPQLLLSLSRRGGYS